jgi:hypothetical protein
VGRFSGTKSSKVSTMVFVSGESVYVCVFWFWAMFTFAK